MSKKWSNHEISILRKVFPLVKNNELKAYFPDRSLGSLVKKAYKLGLKKEGRKMYKKKIEKRGGCNKKWSCEEIELLKKYYPLGGAKLTSQYLNRSLNAIKVRAQVMGVKMKSRKDSWVRKEKVVEEDWTVRKVKVIYVKERSGESLDVH